MRTLIFIVLLMAGCSRPAKVYISPAFNAQVETFQKLTGLMVTIEMRFGRLPLNTDGVCSIGKTTRWITINPVKWEDKSDDAKEQLILHELGHCMFDFTHDDEFIKEDGDIIQASIMNTYSFGGNGLYTKYKEYYYEEYKHKAGLR